MLFPLPGMASPLPHLPLCLGNSHSSLSTGFLYSGRPFLMPLVEIGVLRGALTSPSSATALTPGWLLGGPRPMHDTSASSEPPPAYPRVAPASTLQTKPTP